MKGNRVNFAAEKHEKKAVFMMDVIEEIIKFRKDLDDAKKEIRGINGKNKKSIPAKKTKPAKVAPAALKSASKKKPQTVKKSKPAPKKKPSQVKKTSIPNTVICAKNNQRLCRFFSLYRCILRLC